MNIALVTNSKAGNGIALKLSDEIQSRLNDREVQSTIFLENEWDSSIYDYDQAWIVGGDGTVNFFVNRFHDFKKPICIFKGGTGNDFHALLYSNIDLINQIELVLSSVAKPIDAGKCNENYFLNGVGIGFEGAVAKSLMGVNKLKGKTSFMISILKQIFRYREQVYIIKSGDREIEKKFLMISVANGTRYAGGFYVAPLAKPNDSLLDTNFVKKLSAIQRLLFLPVIEKGKHLNSRKIEYFQTDKISISSDKIIQAHLDGEYLESNELLIEVLPDHFNIIY